MDLRSRDDETNVRRRLTLRPLRPCRWVTEPAASSLYDSVPARNDIGGFNSSVRRLAASGYEASSFIQIHGEHPEFLMLAADIYRPAGIPATFNDHNRIFRKDPARLQDDASGHGHCRLYQTVRLSHHIRAFRKILET